MGPPPARVPLSDASRLDVLRVRVTLHRLARRTRALTGTEMVNWAPVKPVEVGPTLVDVYSVSLLSSRFLHVSSDPDAPKWVIGFPETGDRDARNG